MKLPVITNELIQTIQKLIIQTFFDKYDQAWLKPSLPQEIIKLKNYLNEFSQDPKDQSEFLSDKELNNLLTILINRADTIETKNLLRLLDEFLGLSPEIITVFKDTNILQYKTNQSIKNLLTIYTFDKTLLQTKLNIPQMHFLAKLIHLLNIPENLSTVRAGRDDINSIKKQLIKIIKLADMDEEIINFFHSILILLLAQKKADIGNYLCTNPENGSKIYSIQELFDEYIAKISKLTHPNFQDDLKKIDDLLHNYLEEEHDYIKAKSQLVYLLFNKQIHWQLIEKLKSSYNYTAKEIIELITSDVLNDDSTLKSWTLINKIKPITFPLQQNQLFKLSFSNPNLLKSLDFLYQFNFQLLNLNSFDLLTTDIPDDEKQANLSYFLKTSMLCTLNLIKRNFNHPSQIAEKINQLKDDILKTNLIPDDKVNKNFKTLEKLGDRRLYERTDYFPLVKAIAETLITRPKSSFMLSKIIECCLSLKNVNTENFSILIHAMACYGLLNKITLFNKNLDPIKNNNDFYKNCFEQIEFYKQRNSGLPINYQPSLANVFSCEDEKPSTFRLRFFTADKSTQHVEKISIGNFLPPEKSNYGNQFDMNFKFK